MDTLQAMSTFLRVAETGSLSAAARDLKVGQPAVSKMIAALEARLGVRLLVRTTRTLSLTEAGTAYLERARRAVSEVEEAAIAARGVGASLEGRLKVFAPVTFTRMHLVPRLEPFLLAHPKLALELMLDDRHMDLVSEGADMALRFGPLADSSLVARKLATGGRHVFASRGWLARHPPPRLPSDLESLDTIGFSRMAEGNEWRFRRGTDEQVVRLTPRVTLSAAEGVREAVRAGLGLAIASQWLFAPEAEAGEVVPLLTAWDLPPVDCWCIFPTGRLPTAKARAFARHVETVLAVKREG